ncbi:hypothetical protein UFOVP1244_117 [uncultured Caudovirales phage]|uniref:DUF669 domain-containing protein n=1 Tax=uncultured Caudovirales phage TaxID=2100421 RepID=A0A6J5REJ6_9CAUD|nr:hypothetical protein UFOVP1244_117 [uncultured Caudovirales phage]
MSNFDDFDSLLNTRASDIAETVTIPSGTWVWEVKAIKAANADNGKDGYVLLTLNPVEPCDDVDPVEFRTWNDQGSDDVIFHRISGSVRTVGAQLRSLMERIGLEKSRTPASLYREQFLAHLRWDENKRDATRPWSRLTNFAPLPKSKGEDDTTDSSVPATINDDLPF